jgi:hypothetical protein
MTQSQLDRAVAATTGEALGTIRHLGFGLLDEQPSGLEPEELHLVLDCPFCRNPVAYPGRARSGEQAIAECDRCDVYFDYQPGEVYAAALPASEARTAEAA